MIKAIEILSPLGAVTILEKEEKICGVYFAPLSSFEAKSEETPLLLKAKKELLEYFSGKRTDFDLPLSLKGTEFQLKVWEKLKTIPYGETRTYQEIAQMIGCPKGCRAVGMANHKNPICILIPCHRVVGKNGALTGYAGGLSRKEWLLKREKSL